MSMNRNTYDEDKKKPLSWFERIRKEREEIDPNEPKALDRPSISAFFKLFGRKINTLLYVNLMFIFGNFPIFFALFAFSGYASTATSAPVYQAFAPLLGASYLDPSPVTSSILGVFGLEQTFWLPSTATWILLALTGLLLITFGPVNVGVTYILRAMVREEGFFLWSDFWYAIKRNVKQEFVFGAIDLAVMALLGFDFFWLYIRLDSGSTMYYIMFFLTFAMIIIYAMMRMYIYLMMVTFDLSIAKLLKNALLFTILGIKRNIMALLWILALVALEYVLLFVFFPLAVIFPLIFLFSAGMFGCAFAAYPKIKEIMIDPYYAEHPSVSDSTVE